MWSKQARKLSLWCHKSSCLLEILKLTMHPWMLAKEYRRFAVTMATHKAGGPFETYRRGVPLHFRWLKQKTYIHTYKWHTYYTCVFSMNLLKATHKHTAFIFAHVHASTLVLNPYTYITKCIRRLWISLISLHCIKFSK